jgi:hypothetical protein
MQHDVQDAYDASRRALAGQRESWHPILAAIEGPPCVWRMTAQFEFYGWIRVVRIADEVGYRTETEDGELFGYFRNIRAAAFALHVDFVRSHARPGGING